MEHGIQQVNTTKLAKVEDINEVDKTINSLVTVLKEMTQELKYQNVSFLIEFDGKAKESPFLSTMRIITRFARRFVALK